MVGVVTAREVAGLVTAGAATVPPLVIGRTLPSGPIDWANPLADIRIPRLKASTTGMRFTKHLSTHQFFGEGYNPTTSVHGVDRFLLKFDPRRLGNKRWQPLEAFEGCRSTSKRQRWQDGPASATAGLFLGGLHQEWCR